MISILEFKDVSLTYQTKEKEFLAVDRISFKIKHGEFVAVVGPSGCGKTTILSLASGLLKKSSGTISINDKELEGIADEVGYMFQRDHLFEWRNVRKNIMLGPEIQKKSKLESVKKLAEDLMQKYEISDFANSKPKELSGGMRQRVALIRTLVLSPVILLLDEPFSALDYQTRLSVQNDVYNIIKNEKKTALLVTHDISEAVALADRIIVLTKSPARIKKVFDINLSGTPLERREKPEFSKIFEAVLKEVKSDEE